MLDSLRGIIIGFALGVLSFWLYDLYTQMGKAIETEDPPQIAQEEKKDIECTTVKAFEPKVKRKVKLPKEVRRDKKIHLVDVTRIPADTHDTTVSATYNNEDGEIKMYKYREPLPIAGLKKSFRIGAGYAADQDLATGWAVHGFYNFAQVKGLNIGAGGYLTQHQQGIGMLGFEYTF